MTNIRGCLVALVVIGLLASPRTHGQSSGSRQAHVFESASVRLAGEGSGPRDVGIDAAGRGIARGMLLRDLIQFAYDMPELQRPAQIVGGPEWVRSDRFDIVAAPPSREASRTDRPEASGPSEPSLAMLRHLLADRFQLTTHAEKRNEPIYALRADKQRTTASGLHPSTVQCKRALYAPGGFGQEADVCGVRGVPGRYVGRGATMAQLASVLANFPAVARVVHDETGLRGTFDWQLEWIPAFVASRGGVPLEANPTAAHGVSLET